MLISADNITKKKHSLVTFTLPSEHFIGGEKIQQVQIPYGSQKFPNSALVEHACVTNHEIAWENSEIITHHAIRGDVKDVGEFGGQGQ